jgi:SAM-dependent methyltransferase
MRKILKPALRLLPKSSHDASKKLYRGLAAPFARAGLGLRVKPFSEAWGSDRGQEIARYYVENIFLKEFQSDIRGHVLEFFSDDYTSRFGANVSHVDVLNLEEGLPQTTIRADLTKPNDILDNQFDCIICTHVLHIIYEFDRAIAELHRVLKPGGVLLVAVPHVSMCDPGWHELWRFTNEGLNTALARQFDQANISMRAYGNSLTAAGQIRGLAAHEFSKAQLEKHDLRFAVDICARAKKRG